MASQYYGLRGSLVKDYQKLLNSLGASLSVDGIWGRKTEKAYNLFMDEFNEKLYGSGYADEEEPENLPKPQAIDYTPRTEQQLSEYAERLHGAAFDRQLAAAEQSVQRQSVDKQALIDALTPLYEQQLASLARSYGSDREQLSNQALSRGLGRSSYLTDQLAGSLNEQRAQENLLAWQKNSRQAQLHQEISRLYDDLEAQRHQIASEREQAIWQAIENGRREDQKTQLETLKYNNSLLQDQRDEAESLRRFEEELKIKRAGSLR